MSEIYTDEELLQLIKKGNVSDSVISVLNNYIENETKRLVASWVNSDVTKITSDLGIVNFHESFRQRIKTLLLIQTHFSYDKYQGELANEEIKKRVKSRKNLVRDKLGQPKENK